MRSLWTLALLLTALLVQGAAPRAMFTENKGQWPTSVLYRVMLPSGALFVEREAFTYVLQSGGEAHQHGLTGRTHTEEPLRSHAFRVHFEGGAADAAIGSQRQGHYENFFLGNDPALFGSGCSIFGEVLLKEVWPGIDLRIDGTDGLKYELVVAPGADPSLVRFRYEGHSALSLKNGALVVRTTAGDLVEEPPFTFQDGPLGKRIVGSKYRLMGDLMTFHLDDHDRTLPLTIDPTLAFASYSGSTGNNFGFTATYDAGGHLYGGGIVFNVGYPATLGVLDDSFNGGTIDVGISKWSADGASLEWSTYIGGSGNESPHSMVVNDADELFVFGSTGSADLPTTPGCADNTFGGGPALTFIIGYGYDQPFGTDMFVAHLNNTATALLGCTYLGGSENDGINNAPELAHNYGDSFRGEIIVDADGNPVVASTTASSTLPVTGGGAQTAYGGGAQDGYCFRMDPTLSTVLWSTYIGGQGADAAYGVQVDSDGELFVSGGTASADLPMAGTPFQPAFSGTTDGFIMRYGLSGAFVGSTFVGTPAYDQCYFVQLNLADEVFVVGQTRGNYPVTPGKYTNPGSSQFIHKFGHALNTSQWSTRFGNGTNDQDLSPTAFLVSDCGQIYFSGWGGTVNSGAGNTNSTTTGLPVTADAFQSTTDGDDLYLMLLEPEATALNYATFFGGAMSPEHVDGGTSRFDKNGTVYQAVCAGCQNNDDFPTTPGAWSNTNNATGCNLGVLKFDLARGLAIISIDGPNTICTPGTAQFLNSSSGGNTYAWDFGNGTTSTAEEPLVIYNTVDTFTVTMILSDDSGCRAPDTASVLVITLPPPDALIDPVPPLCLGLSAQLQASGGDTYEWIPATGLNDATIADPVLTPTASGTWSVVVSTVCGNDTASVLIDLGVPQGSAGDDMEICLGQSTILNASGGGTYAWTVDPTLSDLTSATPTATPLDTTLYIVQITTSQGCIASDSVTVIVITGTPEPVLGDTAICTGNSVQLIAPEADTYAWEPVNGLADLTLRDPTVTPAAAQLYVVLVANVCGAIRDSAFVDVIVPVADAWPDSVVCPNEPVLLNASGGVTYAWSPAQGLNNPTLQSPTATITGPATYTVVSTDAFGCVASATLVLDTHTPSFVSAGGDRTIDFGDVVQLAATGAGTLSWEPPTALSCVDCPAPLAEPQETTTYTVTLTDGNGCKVSDAVTVVLNGSLFVPNTFSPNGDDINDVFGAWGKEIETLTMRIFNRWGELIFTGGSLDATWDGTYSGQESPIDTYVWRIDVKELTGRKRSLYGHVNLVR